ncbi:MAG: matrixin family metalloprotease, partial [Phycisphaerales bacterium]|nr:matrixin family metalloprotease [Phycisphaerales bacterium]
DAGDIDARYAGQTATVKQWILATCRQNFARFNVWILDSGRDSPPEGPYSRVYFGGYDPQGLGMALAGTDPCNADPRDEAIVFTQRFTPDLFTHPPDAQQLGVAIGNITAHEIGHLLGLHHVRDNLALMNTYDAPDYLLLDQSFKNTVFDIHTFPVIDARLRQDAVLLLAETVGLVPPAIDTETAVGTEPAALVAGDWDGDGRPDLAMADPTASTLWLLNNDGHGSFTIDDLGLPGRNPVFVVSGDFNDDGRTDLVTVNFRSDTVSLLPGRDDGTFGPPVDFAAGFGPQLAAATDFDGSGTLDLAVLNMLTDEIAVLLNEGNGTLAEPIVAGRATNLSDLAAGDFDGDGFPDLAYAHVGGWDELGGVAILWNRGALNFTAGDRMAESTLPVALIAVDLNKDQAPDLVLADIYTDSVAVLLNDGRGNFAAPVFYPTGGYPCAIAAGDLDNDGRTDLAVANRETGDVSMLFNRGDGTFEPQWPYRIGSEPYALVLVDLDGDGNLDVVTVNQTAGTVATLMNHGQRSFGRGP